MRGFDSRGSVLVESALCFPILLLVVFTCIQLGPLFVQDLVGEYALYEMVRLGSRGEYGSRNSHDNLNAAEARAREVCGWVLPKLSSTESRADPLAMHLEMEMPIQIPFAQILLGKKRSARDDNLLIEKELKMR